jgi:hypothetical protein
MFDTFDRDGGWPMLTTVQRSLADRNTTHALSAGQLILERLGPSIIGHMNVS